MVLLQAGMGLLCGALLWSFSLPLAVVGLLAGGMAPRFYIRRMARQRLARFEDQLPDTLQLLSMSIRGGFSLFQALQLLSSEAEEPSRSRSRIRSRS